MCSISVNYGPNLDAVGELTLSTFPWSELAAEVLFSSVMTNRLATGLIPRNASKLVSDLKARY